MQKDKLCAIKNAYSVLLAGGSGTRLWPVSRDLHPKQLVKFMGEDSLIQNTINRLSPVLSKDILKVVCGVEHYHEIARHLEWIGVEPEGRVLYEPCGRNTAPAILFAVLDIIKTANDPVIFVFPADHIIKDISKFHKKVQDAASLAQSGYIVTFGIKPLYPEAGYGYIEGGEKVETEDGESQALKIMSFVEKPDGEIAAGYIKAGNFFWNSGMFAFKASVIIEEFKKFQPDLYDKLRGFLLANETLTKIEYEQLPDISIDYAIMEKTDKGVVLPSDFGWSDIGSWKTIYDFSPKDENRNVIAGNVITNKTSNCFIMGEKRLIATNHLKDIVVVETSDSIFVSDIENSRDVKSIVLKLKEEGRVEHRRHQTVFYSWGREVLIEKQEGNKTSRILIYPGGTCETEVDPETLVHIIVLDESVDVLTKKSQKRLKKGASLVISHAGFFKISNPDEVNASVMLVEIRTKFEKLSVAVNGLKPET